MKIAIAGYGQEGKASFQYWNKPDNTLTIVDERPTLESTPSGIDVRLGADALKELHDFDMVVRTASLAPKKIVTNGKIWSATNEFFAKCPAPIIGVTGTKGKGTTCSLITSILRSAGKTVHLVGNIGVASLEVLPEIKADDIVVFELSSFQLWDIEKSPHVAVVLKIEPDHLDIHADFDDYVKAKSNIRRFQSDGDSCFYHPTNPISETIASLHQGAVRYNAPDEGGVYEEDGMFKQNGEVICSVEALQIPGAHNIENACAALSVARLFVSDKHAIEQGLQNFTGLPHRLKFIRELHGVRYFDDSYSSAPGATIAAINVFTEPKVLIMGGYDKGADFTELARAIASTKTITYIFLIGQMRTNLHETFIANGVNPAILKICDSTNFSEVITQAREVAVPGDLVILSPACASFDMFKNFTERGEIFTRLVEAL